MKLLKPLGWTFSNPAPCPQLYIALFSRDVPTFYHHHMNRSESRQQINCLNRWVRGGGGALLAEPAKLRLQKHSMGRCVAEPVAKRGSPVLRASSGKHNSA